jgi:hypothetical protein
MNGDTAQVELARVVGPWCDSSWYSKEVALANGRLIAAAPDLLEQCKYLLENAEAAGWSDFMLAGARAAIAIAESG